MHNKLNNRLLAELQFISLTFLRLFFHSEFKIKINHWWYSSFSLEWWRILSLMQTHAHVVTHFQSLWRRRHDGSGCFFQARVYCNDTRHWLTVEPRQTWPGRLSVSWEERRLRRRETIFPPQPPQVETGTNFSHRSPSLPIRSFPRGFNHNSDSLFINTLDKINSENAFAWFTTLRLSVLKNAGFFQAWMKFSSLVWNEVDTMQTLKNY